MKFDRSSLTKKITTTQTTQTRSHLNTGSLITMMEQASRHKRMMISSTHRVTRLTRWHLRLENFVLSESKRELKIMSSVLKTQWGTWTTKLKMMHMCIVTLVKWPKSLTYPTMRWSVRTTAAMSLESYWLTVWNPTSIHQVIRLPTKLLSPRKRVTWMTTA